jgi:hypothetical protein
MSDTVRQRLDDLNRQIQIQRNIEMHAAMERARLETQRVELMSQMLTSSVAPPATITPMSPYRVVLQTPAPGNVLPPNPASLVDRRRKHKPDGLPSITAMIAAVSRKRRGCDPPRSPILSGSSGGRICRPPQSAPRRGGWCVRDT